MVLNLLKGKFNFYGHVNEPSESGYPTTHFASLCVYLTDEVLPLLHTAALRVYVLSLNDRTQRRLLTALSQ